MAKVQIFNNVLSIVSNYSLQQLMEVYQGKPDASALKEQKDDEIVEVFRVFAGEREAISKYGIVFASETRGGNAVYNTQIDPDCADDQIKEWVANNFGSVIANLSKVEAQIAVAVAQLAQEKETVMQSIEIVG